MNSACGAVSPTYLMPVGSYFPVVRWLGGETQYFSPYKAEVKNEWG
jgi:hypothetical protein